MASEISPYFVKGTKHMADISPTPEDSLSDATLISDSEYRPEPTGLQQVVLTCPECGAVVVKIVGNTMELLYSHIREKSEKPDEHGHVSLVFCHTTYDQGMFVPPREYVPPPALSHPYLNVQSTEMTSHPHK
jgi:hypothetical protein